MMQKIMIVEDDPKIAEHLRTHIEKYNFVVRCVMDFDLWHSNHVKSSVIRNAVLSIEGSYLSVEGEGKVPKLKNRRKNFAYLVIIIKKGLNRRRDSAYCHKKYEKGSFCFA